MLIRKIVGERARFAASFRIQTNVDRSAAQHASEQ
jgi:hypothetical protein